MARMLDIDMDFFLNRIATERIGNERLDEKEYIPWKEQKFRAFLEENCRMSKMEKIRGRIIEEHDEAFYFWKELIKKKEINCPFFITHLDAHTDLKAGYPNKGSKYILSELLHLPMKDRLESVNTHEMGPANYLSYAIACGFFNSVELVFHSDLDCHSAELPKLFFKNESPCSGVIEMKSYSESEVRYQNFGEPGSKDKEIPFRIIRGDDFQVDQNYDFLTFCKSPGYTPKTADFMLDVVKEYIIEV